MYERTYIGGVILVPLYPTSSLVRGILCSRMDDDGEEACHVGVGSYNSVVLPSNFLLHQFVCINKSKRG